MKLEGNSGVRDKRGVEEEGMRGESDQNTFIVCMHECHKQQAETKSSIPLPDFRHEKNKNQDYLHSFISFYYCLSNEHNFNILKHHACELALSWA